MIKRILTIPGASIGLIFTISAWLPIDLPIKLKLEGPALFRQERIDRYRRTFTMLKFRAAFASGIIALGLYLLTIAPDLTWANASLDGVELVTASATLGIPHPPGYPTYIILGKAFSWLPLGSVAFRYNLFSAMAVAGAVGILALVIGALHERVRPTTAMAAALLFAFAPLVWSQAVVAEIYGLNLLFLAIFLLVWVQRGSTGWAGFWLGLAITTHLTSIFFLPALMITSGRKFWRPLVGMGIGLFPLLLLPLLAGGDSPIVWGRPTDIQGWWWLVSGRLYNANLRPTFDIDHLAGIWRALALGPIGMIAGSLQTPPAPAGSLGSTSNRRMIRLLGSTAVLYLLFAIFYHTPDAAINLLPAMMILALLIAPTLDRLGKAALLLPIILVAVTFPARNLSGDYEVRLNAQSLLMETPENALLLTPGNRTIFTILYFQHVEETRPDIMVADANLFAFDWYRDRLKAQYPELYVPEGDDLDSFRRVNKEMRTFCRANLVPGAAELPIDSRRRETRSLASPQLDCE